jgi:hypothetical protein
MHLVCNSGQRTVGKQRKQTRQYLERSRALQAALATGERVNKDRNDKEQK